MGTLFALWIALLVGPARAHGPAVTVTVDPLTAAIGFAHVQVEARLAPRASLYFGPSLKLYDGIFAPVNGPYAAHGVESGLRLFLKPGAPEGAWLMTRGVLAHGTTRGQTPRETAWMAYGSVLVGGTRIAASGFTLSGGLGVSGFRYEVGGYGVRGPGIAAHTALGWAFPIPARGER